MTDSQDFPSWDRLLELAQRQGGFFTTPQAHDCGFSNQLLRHHLNSGRFRRVRRRIYRAVELPERHPRLYLAWLATRGEGTYSHGTALWLHGLRSELPEPYHLVLPPRWRPRQRSLPPWVEVCFEHLDPEERVWLQGVTAVSAGRALQETTEAGEP